MKIVVIGGTGRIGSKVVARLRGAGHDAAAPNTGVNTVTGEGLEAALEGAHVIVDLANSPSFEPSAVMGFFTAHERNLLAAEAHSGVRHHVALSIVGDDRSPDNGYFRAKVAQEDLIKVSGIPYTGPDRFRRMASPLTDSSLILHRRHARELCGLRHELTSGDERRRRLYDDQTRCICPALPHERYSDGSGV